MIQNTYKIFDLLHISTFLSVICFSVIYILIFGKAKDGRIKKQGKYLLIILLILVIAIRFAVNYAYNLLDISNLLPLQLCAIVLLFAFALLIFEKQIFLDICYFVGFPATMGAALFPYISLAQPLEFRLVFFVIFHTLLALAPFYMIFVLKKIPSFKWLLLIFISLNIIAFGIIYPINIMYNRNFMFLMKGPEHTPFKILDDMLGHALYLIALELIAIVVLLIMSFMLIIIKKHLKRERTGQ